MNGDQNVSQILDEAQRELEARLRKHLACSQAYPSERGSYGDLDQTHTPYQRLQVRMGVKQPAKKLSRSRHARAAEKRREAVLHKARKSCEAAAQASTPELAKAHALQALSYCAMFDACVKEEEQMTHRIHLARTRGGYRTQAPREPARRMAVQLALEKKPKDGWRSAAQAAHDIAPEVTQFIEHHGINIQSRGPALIRLVIKWIGPVDLAP